jgi:hypothetical protein
VDYVPAVHPADPLKRVRRWPDVLRDLPPDGFSAPPGEVRALWLSVRVPAGAAPGEYAGTVTVTAADGDAQTLPVHLRVHDVLLPDPSAWALRVDFWQGFYALARQYQVPEWSEEWWALARTFLEDLAAHGESVVQVGRGYFDWKRQADGSWSFGFERFDRYVELCASLGISGLIEYLQMFDGRADTTIGWTGADGSPQTATANPGDPAFDDLWLAFAKALAEHCKAKGWWNRLYVCPTDEPQDVYGPPTLDRFRHCVELLRQADPGHRVTAALDSLASAKELSPFIDRYVLKLRADVYDAAWAKALRGSGKLVETYICCHPERPNSFITSEPVEQRAIGWICHQEGFEGLLRWSYVNWPADPWNQPEGDGAYTAGDLFIVYPGDRRPIASARWERMRDGFEDYEMLRAVTSMIAKSPSGPARDAATKAYQEAVTQIAGPPGEVTSYTTDPQVLLAARRRLLATADGLR